MAQEAQYELPVNPDELALVARQFTAMPSQCRQVFTLRKVYGYSQKEIATRLSIPESEVEKHLTQAACHCVQAALTELAPEGRTTLLYRLRRRISST
jgi:DNA-directed RNA polymerase specialized sigma24 family protein